MAFVSGGGSHVLCSHGIRVLPELYGISAVPSGEFPVSSGKEKELALQRQEELRRQFKEAVLILSSSLGAGYSVENAFAGSLRELEELYGREGMITKEFSYIAHQLRMNRTVETLLAEFADRSGLEEIKNFPISLLFQSGAEVNWYR